MRNLYLLGIILPFLAACTSDVLNESVTSGHKVTSDVTPETLTIGFDEEVDTRVQLQEEKTVWNKGDLVSVFYLSDANQKWQFQGDTGDRIGDIKLVENADATRTLDKVVVVYPYNPGYYINPESGDVRAFLPSTQTYLENSYGVGANLMISSSEYNQFSLKNVCGWLKIQLTGDDVKINSIKLYGNDSEQVAGEIYVDSQDATSVLASDRGTSENVTQVTLDCGDGVGLGAEPVSFYIALPPQKFSQGLTVEITDGKGLSMTKSTANEVVISRNVIQPMKCFEFAPDIPETWKIHYTAKSKITPYKTTVFGVDFVSSEWNQDTGEGVMIFDGEVKYIGPNAFNGLASPLLSNLTGITIPEGVETVFTSAFYGCTGLQEFKGKFATEDGKGLIAGDVFTAYAVGNKASEYVIPNGVKAVGYGAFYKAGNLTDITIPNTVKVIEGHAFQRAGLTSVTIPEGTKSIGEYAFDFCDNLSSVTLGSTVGAIRHCAFYGCSNLHSITVPSGVSLIGSDAFANYDNLTEIHLQSLLPPDIEGSIFYYYDGGGVKIYVYEEALDLYKEKWSRYSAKIFSDGASPDSDVTTTIFYTTSDGQTITPNNNWTIKSNEYNGGVGKLVIEGNISSIPSRSFQYKSTLTSMTLPESISVIGSDAFYSCSKLTDINIPYGVTEIGDSAFNSCGKLSGITLHRGLSWIEEYTFSGCYNLSSIVIPCTVETIYNQAFSFINSLDVYFMSPNPPYVFNGSASNAFQSGVKIYVPSGCVDEFKSNTCWSTSNISEYDPIY